MDGTEVTIVEFMPNIVPVEDEDISKQMERWKKQESKSWQTRLLRELILLSR
jgi:pyruvate/2-oxoglutarate dehydrogenase complex dihydrolipoamide dehydrogenase (E3) component